MRTAPLLGLSRASLGRVLGVRSTAIGRFVSGSHTIDSASKEGELASMLIRLYRSLDVLVGAVTSQRKAWMRGYNRSLNGEPARLIERIDGLVAVVNYLESMRAAAHRGTLMHE